MPIVIPFRKALGSPVLMAPRYRPKNQLVINTSITNKKKLGLLSKKTHFSKILIVLEPIPYVFLPAPNSLTMGHLTPWSEKKWNWYRKVIFSCLWWLVLITHWFLDLYLGAIGTGLPRAFRNGMTIGITPKNEVLRVKSLKQPILQEIKESSKFGNYGPP